MLRTKQQLDEITLNIEFILISVVQGLALQVLALNAVGPINNLQLAYWPYIASGFTLILIFWSQAIVHSLSFINWPLDLTHDFFYFLASFVEVLAFGQMTNPLKWFEYVATFLVISFLLYAVDLSLINRQKNRFATQTLRRLYRHVKQQHRLEMFVLVPSAFFYSLVAIYLIRTRPDLFLNNHYHIALASIQAVISIAVLIHSIRNFRERSTLLASV